MNPESLADRDRLRSEAVRWYVERLSGDMTLEDEHRFLDWLDRSPAHRKAYRTVDRAWLITGMAKDDPALSDSRAQLASAAPMRVAPNRLRLFATAASILLAVGIGSSAIAPYLVGDHDGQVQAFQTATGQRTTITLPDGSIVTLDSQTAMRFTDLAEERRVELFRGRAFFKVAHNPSRPFTVTAAGKRVRAIGTAFEVSVDRGEMAVVLAEGKVRVEEVQKTANGTDMTAGRQLVVSPNRQWTVSTVDVKKEIGWTEGRLIFMRDPLAKAIEEVNRYSTRKLTFKDGQIPDKEIVGVFSAGDVESFITALELNGIAKRVSTTPDEIIMEKDGR
ncbi:FecR domain-containing protein [uncultured Sphingomonas sp.]|uniref:FecR family protein n=1 Tax=uncultured Sphingomonas sp. TaxID=158754 RepID=UPI00263400D2|nr:FecR domain-containing protein [uncultured Sphingomonas sp.]